MRSSLAKHTIQRLSSKRARQIEIRIPVPVYTILYKLSKINIHDCAIVDGQNSCFITQELKLIQAIFTSYRMNIIVA